MDIKEVHFVMPDTGCIISLVCFLGDAPRVRISEVAVVDALRTLFRRVPVRFASYGLCGWHTAA